MIDKNKIDENEIDKDRINKNAVNSKCDNKRKNWPTFSTLLRPIITDYLFFGVKKILNFL